MYRLYLNITTGGTTTQYDATDELRNWADVSLSYKRDGLSGVVRSFSTEFEFVGTARAALVAAYIADGVRTVASVQFQQRDAIAYTYATLFTCALDFSTFRYDALVASVNAIDNTIAGKLKAQASQKYQWSVSSLTGRDVTYHHLPMLNTIGYVFGGYTDEDTQITYANIYAKSGNQACYTTLKLLQVSSEIAVKGTSDFGDGDYDAGVTEHLEDKVRQMFIDALEQAIYERADTKPAFDAIGVYFKGMLPGDAAFGAQVDAELDETKMAMVITNLVENAVKYNRDGGSVTVTIDAGLRNFSISVADTGIGIPEESLPQIFDRFYRVDKSRSRAVGGTGLGLSIARSVVLQHHGTLEVQSRLGVGTTFIMKIPILYVEQPAAATAENSRRSGRRAPARRTGFLQSIFGGRGRRSSAASSKKKSGRTASAGRSTKGTAAASSAGRSTTAVSAGRRASGTAAGRTAAGKTAAAGKARTGSSAGSTAGRTASKSGTAAKNVKKTGAGNVMPTVGAAGSSDGRARRTGKGRTNRRG